MFGKAFWEKNGIPTITCSKHDRTILKASLLRKFFFSCHMCLIGLANIQCPAFYQDLPTFQHPPALMDGLNISKQPYVAIVIAWLPLLNQMSFVPLKKKIPKHINTHLQPQRYWMAFLQENKQIPAWIHSWHTGLLTGVTLPLHAEAWSPLSSTQRLFCHHLQGGFYRICLHLFPLEGQNPEETLERRNENPNESPGRSWKELGNELNKHQAGSSGPLTERLETPRKANKITASTAGNRAFPYHLDHTIH